MSMLTLGNPIVLLNIMNKRYLSSVNLVIAVLSVKHFLTSVMSMMILISTIRQ